MPTKRCIIRWYRASLDPVAYEHLLHIIVSHHGQKSWGSPVEPMTREGRVFHLLDMVDAQMGIIDNALAAGVDADGLTGYNSAL